MCKFIYACHVCCQTCDYYYVQSTVIAQSLTHVIPGMTCKRISNSYLVVKKYYVVNSLYVKLVRERSYIFSNTEYETHNSSLNAPWICKVVNTQTTSKPKGKGLFLSVKGGPSSPLKRKFPQHSSNSP